MLDLLAKGTDRGYSMIGVGLSAGLSGSRRARTVQDPLPALDLDWATNRSLPASYGPTPTFTRASTGTYFDGQGILKSAAVNGPRFNHTFNGTSWVSRGLLVEDQRTNLNLRSEEFDNAEYSKNQCAVVANQVAAPDGATTADKLTATSGTVNPYAYQAVTTANGSVYTFSIYVKKNTHDFVQIVLNGVANGFANFDINNGVLGTLGAGGSAASSIVNVGNGWYRCVVTYTTASTSGNGFINLIGSATAGRGATFTAAGTESVYLWGQQLELGAFPTSYIGTTNSSVVRSADVCQITGSGFSGFYNQSEGSFVGEYEVFNTSSLSFLSQIDDSTNTNRFYFAGSRANSKNGFSVIGAVTGGQDFDCSTVSPNSLIKIAVGLKAQNYQAYSGSSSVSDAVEGLPNATLNRMQIGQRAGDFFLNGHIARLRYYPVRLSNAKLQELST